MKKMVILFFLFLYSLPILSQEGFLFKNGANKVTIPFKFINNLIFIPIKVNGIELNFLLDTGVEETILFSLDDKKEVSFFNVEKISLRGLGSEKPIDGLKSTNNILETGDFKSKNQLLYIVLDQEFNLSSHIGIPVNGIIGYHFFKNNLIEINYQRKRIIVYKESNKIRNKIEKRYEKIPMSIEKSKPYIEGFVFFDKEKIPAKLLIDIGNSDAIWLFPNVSEAIKIPAKNFDDFLGVGFSGDVEGKRARISKFSMDNFEFENPIVAFPDSNSIKNAKMVQDRVGSIGGEIMKRFSVVFDYKNNSMFLKKNIYFNTPFTYNKSGIEVQHNGLQWVQETVRLQTVPLSENVYETKANKYNDNFKYKFELKPIYIISAIRKKSPAALSGLQKNDVIIAINNTPAYRYSLQKINSLLKSEEEDWITFEVERDSQILKFKFQLLNVL